MVVPKQVKLLRHHGRKLPEPHLERLIVLLVLLLQDNGQAARVAANVLSERYQLLDQLLICMEGDGELPSVAAKTLLEVLRKHGAAPSAVLQRCDIRTGRLTALLRPPKPSQPGRAQPPTSMLKVPPWHWGSAPVPPEGAPAWRPCGQLLRAARHAQEQVGPLSAQPLPRLLEPAASRAAKSSAFDLPGPPL